MDVESEDSYVARNTNFRSGEGFVLNLSPDQESALAAFLMNLKLHPEKYNPFLRNCASEVQSGLTAVGVKLNGQWINWLQEIPGSGIPIPTETPYDLVFQLEDTPGLVKQTISHTQQTRAQ